MNRCEDKLLSSGQAIIINLPKERETEIKIGQMHSIMLDLITSINIIKMAKCNLGRVNPFTARVNVGVP